MTLLATRAGRSDRVPGWQSRKATSLVFLVESVCTNTEARAEDGRVSADGRGNCRSSHCRGAVRLHVAADAQLGARHSCQRTSAWTRSFEGVTGFCSVSRESGHIFI